MLNIDGLTWTVFAIILELISQFTFTCSKSAIETLQEVIKFVQSLL